MLLLHTIWIGPPSTIEKNDAPGHAECGPKKIARALSTDQPELNYWCLEEYKDHFEILFSSDTKITVRCIETYLHETAHPVEIEPYARFLKSLIPALLCDTERNTIKDRITVKNAFALFLLISHGGYVFDTNMEPIEGMDVHFPESEAMRVPLLAKYIADISNYRSNDFDWWLMYANPKSLASKTRAFNIFDRWIASYRKAEEIFSVSKYSPAYFDILSDIGTQSVLLTRNKSSGIDCTALEPIPTEPSEGKTCVKIRSMGIQKYYFNTHRYQAYIKKEYHPQIFISIRYGYLKQLEELLTYGADPNQLIALDSNYLLISPLCLALSLRDKEAVQLLLRFGASIEQECTLIYRDNKTYIKTIKAFASDIGASDLLLPDTMFTDRDRFFSRSLPITTEKDEASAAAPKPKKSEFFIAAEEACAHVHAICPLGSANRHNGISYDTQAQALKALSIEKMDFDTQVQNILSTSSTTDSAYFKIIELLASIARKTKAGNCQEMAALAFLFLKEQDIYPIEIVSIPTHTFVLIGRNKSTPIHDPKAWNKETIVCDPWWREHISSGEDYILEGSMIHGAEKLMDKLGEKQCASLHVGHGIYEPSLEETADVCLRM